MKDRPWIGAVIGAVGPFVHDALLFTWFCPAILALWLRPNLRTCLALVAPLVTTAIVYFGPSPEAGVAQMQPAALPDDVRAFTVAYPFGQTFLSSLHIVLWKISHSFSSFLIAVVYFTVPASLLVVLYGRTAEIVRDGDRIFITCDPHDEKVKMTYFGRLHGNRVSGTYSGGVWAAIILR